jgi:hypothetical protein
MTHDAAADPASKLADRFNYLPIAVFGFWAGPILSLWAQLLWLHPPGAWFAAALALGLLTLALPKAWFRPRAFEAGMYRTLRIPAFRRYATNGDAIVRAVRRRFPGYTVHRGDLAKILSNTRIGELSHLALFVFGLVTTLYVTVIGWHAWAIWTAVTNVVGNLYPALLQRYTRGRLSRIRRLRR